MTASILVFIRTSYFRNDPQYSGGTVARLLTPTDSTASLVQAALQGLHQIYREGFKYAKAGFACWISLRSSKRMRSAPYSLPVQWSIPPTDLR
ncbi:hypothetical protein EYC51_00025 [Alcaligenes faecalis]|nr:hypothetical protein EYC51_00025 [Alcaligenes faecalis]